MTTIELGSFVLFAASAGGLFAVVGLYPLALRCLRHLGAPLHALRGGFVPSVSVIVAVRNGEALVEAKVRNSLELSTPGTLELVFVSDGSRDATVERLHAAGAGRIHVVALAEHVGKARALDEGVRASSGEILVFSDVDALLEPGALRHLVERFDDPMVGGACGQRVILDAGVELGVAQSGYVAADSVLKRLEARLGSVSSNDGKVYAIRRAHYRPIDPGATDDLFACLSVIEQGARFVFEPRARARIPMPSRNAGHELARRRRIVARSLHGIALKRGLLNPLRHGGFSFQLLVNKVMRRMLPIFLGSLLLSSAVLSIDHPWARLALAVQLAFYVLAAAHHRLAAAPGVGFASSLAYYFCVGNLGTLLGLMDFLRGRVTTKWDPIKSG